MANAIVDKSFDFAVRIVNLYTYLKDNKKEYVLSKQLLRSGTSIGANVSESQEAQSDPDFLSKLYIALKECSETRYWLKLLFHCNILSEVEYFSMEDDAAEIHSILVAIIKSTKSNRNINVTESKGNNSKF